MAEPQSRRAPGRGRGGLVSALAVLAALLSGCGSDGIATYSTYADLTRAALARVQTDRSVYFGSELTITINGKETMNTVVEARGVLAPDGERQSSHERQTQNGVTTESEMIVLPDAAYVLLKPADRAPDGRPYLRLDPYATDPFSLSFASSVRAVHQTGTRIYCLTELGTAEISDVAPTVVDGTPVMRYQIDVNLMRGTIQPLATAMYRQFGLTSLRVQMDMDAADHILGCTTDQDFPGGLGHVHSRQYFTRFGAPVEVDAPPGSQVTTVVPHVDVPS
jgi:hypothetical protein